MNKKLISFALILGLAATLGACGETEDTDTTTTPEATPAATETPAAAPATETPAASPSK